MKRFTGLLLAVVLAASNANAAHQLVSPGLNTIQAKITAAALNGFVTSGPPDSVLLRDGTYTFSATNGSMIFDSGFNGNTCTGMVVTSMHALGATISQPGGGTFIYGGDAANVTISNMNWQAVAAATPDAWLRDLSGSAYAGWTFDTIVMKYMGATARVPFLISAATGAGITIRNITTTSAFNAAYVVSITGSASDLNLHIQNCDVTLHTAGSMVSGFLLIDCRKFEVANCSVYGITADGIEARSTDVAKGLYNFDICYNTINGAGTSAGPGIHIGNANLDRVCIGGRVYCNTVSNINSYGIEAEGGATDCEIVGNSISTVVSNGIPIPDDVHNILVAYNTIDGVSGNFCAGVALVCSEGDRVINNIIRNVVGTGGNGCAIRINENCDIATENEWSVVRGNVIYNVDSVYHVTAAAMPQGVNANKLGPNTYANIVTTYATADGVAKTQAQFAALFPVSIYAADTVGPNTGWIVGGPTRASGGLIHVTVGE